MQITNLLQLSHKEIHIWQMPIKYDFCTRYSHFAIDKLLSHEELKRYQAFKVPGKQNEFLHSRLLLRKLIVCYTPYQSENVQIVPDHFGKPFFSHKAQRILPFFNLSHTEGTIVCIVGHMSQLGCDIEFLQNDVDFDDLIEQVLCPAEIEDYQALPRSQRQPFFVRAWTLKEAYTKALGQGLHIPLQSLCVDNIFTDDSLQIKHIGKLPNLPDLPQQWFFRIVMPTAKTYVALAAVTSSLPTLRFFKAAINR